MAWWLAWLWWCCLLLRAQQMTSVPVDQKVYRGIMEGLGLKRDGEATINYQERGPLVLPPNPRSAAARKQRCGDHQQSVLAEGS